MRNHPAVKIILMIAGIMAASFGWLMVFAAFSPNETDIVEPFPGSAVVLGVLSVTLTMLIAQRSTAVAWRERIRSDLSDIRVTEDYVQRLNAELRRYPMQDGAQQSEQIERVRETEALLASKRLAYNESVEQYNRSIREFPLNLVRPILGFKTQDYYR